MKKDSDGKRQVHLRISEEQYCMLQEMWKENCMTIGRIVSKSEFIREKLFSSKSREEYIFLKDGTAIAKWQIEDATNGRR
tara:strand:- start:1429 stop:1668 length:240 start_codon:yes stop_codon:yes gene_type:complete